MTGYIGIGGTAKKIKNIYIGVGGVAKKVKKAYIGVGGVAKLWYTSESVIGTWVFNSTIAMEEIGTAYAVNFTSNVSSYNRIYFTGYGSTRLLIYGNTSVYSANGWVAPGYKTIVITDGTDANNPDLLTWLQANATRQA